MAITIAHQRSSFNTQKPSEFLFTKPRNLLLLKYLNFLTCGPTFRDKLNSIPLSLRLRGIKFDILTPNQRKKSSLEHLID
jgi:hypothetical protein